MLAKDIKIRNIKRQREFIEEQLRVFLNDPKEDGDTLYRYAGYIFPEVLYHFAKEGFHINCYDSEKVICETKGLPIYIFTISDSVELTEKEIEEAEKFEYKDIDEMTREEIIKSMFGSMGGMMN